LKHNQWKKEEVILIADIANIELVYFGKQDEGSSTWQTDWTLPYLPQLIKFKITTTQDVQWPNIILKLNNYENLPKNTNLFEKALKTLNAKKKKNASSNANPSKPF
jgi:hypothetical protein